MLEISNNSISIFRSCQKKYYWNYIKGYAPFKKSNALSLGSIFHSAFNMFYNGCTDEEIVKFITDTCNDLIAQAPADQEEDFVIMKYTLLGMWMYYPKDLSLFSDIKPEITVRLKFIYGTRIILKADGLVTNADGRIWIREVKTSGLPFSQFERRCQLSHQASLYTYALKKLGYPVDGVMFDYIKKPGLRKSMKENKDQFGYRIMMDYKARPDFYYQRHFAYLSNEKLELFEKDLKATTKDIKRRCRDGEWSRDTDSCWKYNSPCPYLPICFMREPDLLTIQLFFKQEEINPEKGGKSNDKKRNKTSHY